MTIGTQRFALQTRRSPGPKSFALADGTRLVNLKDAADLLTGERFVGVTKWVALDRAIELVTAAGELGGRDRIKAATDQVEIVLRERHML